MKSYMIYYRVYLRGRKGSGKGFAMAKKDPVVKTKRLKIEPMSNDELRRLASSTKDPELKSAYGEMLAGCESDPEHRIWYTAWKISLKAEECVIGDIGFKGPAKNHAVEIGYGIRKEYEGRGYATEAARALTDWAFTNEDIYFIEAETEPDNKASQRILEKLEFKPDGEGEEGPRFVKEQRDTQWMPIYMCLGMSIGMCLGTSFDNIAIGTSMGMCLGLCIGAALDSSFKKKREKIRKERNANEKDK